MKKDKAIVIGTLIPAALMAMAALSQNAKWTTDSLYVGDAPIISVEDYPVIRVSEPQSSLTGYARSADYYQGWNDAADAIMFHSLELALKGERMTWGERFDVLRERFNIPDPQTP